MQLKSMEIRRCEITDEGMMAFLESLKTNEALEIFELSDNKMSDAVSGPLMAEIKRRKELKQQDDLKRAELHKIKLAGDAKRYKREEKEWQEKRRAASLERRKKAETDTAKTMILEGKVPQSDAVVKLHDTIAEMNKKFSEAIAALQAEVDGLKKAKTKSCKPEEGAVTKQTDELELEVEDDYDDSI